VTRVGWSIAALLVLVAAALASVTSFGVADRSAHSAATEAVPPKTGLVVPVAGYPRRALTDSWGDARGGGTRGHRGIDIMAPGGRPVLAVAAGRVEKLFQSRLGGTTLYLRSADGSWTYYYAHLSGYAAGVREGLAVRAGQVLGYVGDTGDAGAGNTHLHFSTTRMQPGEGWWQGQDVNPYPILAQDGPGG